MIFGISASKTIGGIFMNDNGNQDEMGIRGTQVGGNLSYNTNGGFAWFGSGIMDKPIGDFFDDSDPPSTHSRGHTSHVPAAPYFSNPGGVTIIFRRQVIPEPAEYALVFGLFVLGFFLFRRRFQKKTRKGGIAV